jgi:hypothetical protein
MEKEENEMSIKPIETIYNGYRFRSRLEARWAVFFDAMGIEYKYEPEGFEIDGIKYLPDFYLPDADRWVEIKGKKLSKEEVEKCERFCEAQDKDGVKFTIFIGQPAENIIGLKPSKDKKSVSYTVDPNEAAFMGIMGHSYQWKTYDLEIPGNPRQHIEEDPAVFMNPRLCDDEYLSRFMPSLWFDAKVPKETLIKSVVISRQARFEHGERPTV